MSGDSPQDVVYWDTPPPRKSRGKIEYVAPFSARGMKRAYGRGDRFSGRAALNMDIWQNRAGQLFVRFWSRNEEVDEYSLTISGVDPVFEPDTVREHGFSDAWIPQALRDEYESWVVSEC